MQEDVEYDYRLLAWKVAYFENGYIFAPPQFTFEEKPSEQLLIQCRAEARAAFDAKKE